MAKTRGTTIIPRIKYLRARGVWDDIVPHLSEDTRAIVSSPVLASTWYPFATLVDVIRTADRVVGAGDLALAKDMGRYAATSNLSTVFRILVRLATPKSVLAKGASLWGLHHDTGTASAAEDGPSGATYEIRNFTAADRALCVSLEGWIERLMEITGAKNVQVREEECVVKGGAVCRFRGSWK